MNTMELVRTVERAQPRSTSTRQPGPLFHSELIGPARHSILRGRQFLVGEQLENGSWLGAQRVDASLSSQLVLRLAYLGKEQCELAQQAAATILEQQQPCGGWSLVPNGRPDVSTSVQAYFALKLTGIEPSDERLSRARPVIRRLGGADAADCATRYFLALLGQVDYDCCPAVPPEWLSFNGFSPQMRVPLSIIWSHRPVRDVGIERGVRELFVNKPRNWPRPAPAAIGRGGPSLRATIRSISEFAVRLCEHRGWTPLRGSGLERAETELLDNLRPGQIEQLDFSELLWHAIAIGTLGYADDSRERSACEQRLRIMVSTDVDGERATPRLRTSPIADTAVVLHALQASGIASNHPAVTRAIRQLTESRGFASRLDGADLAHLFSAVAAATDCDIESNDSLPPTIEVSREERCDAEETGRRKTRLRRMKRFADQLREQLEKQLRNSPDEVGTILEAIAAAGGESATPEVDRAVACLRAAQCADGSWDDRSGAGRIHATSRAVRGLAAAGVPDDDDAIAAGVHWIVVHQQPSGGWGEPSDYERETKTSHPPTVSHTAFALLALVAAGRANHPAARRAVQFLIDSQENDGRWPEPHFVARDAATGRWYGNDLHLAAWPLLALSRWAVAATGIQQKGGDSVSLRLVNGPIEN